MQVYCSQVTETLKISKMPIQEDLRVCFSVRHVYEFWRTSCEIRSSYAGCRTYTLAVQLHQLLKNWELSVWRRRHKSFTALLFHKKPWLRSWTASLEQLFLLRFGCCGNTLASPSLWLQATKYNISPSHQLQRDCQEKLSREAASCQEKRTTRELCWDRLLFAEKDSKKKKATPSLLWLKSSFITSSTSLVTPRRRRKSHH